MCLPRFIQIYFNHFGREPVLGILSRGAKRPLFETYKTKQYTSLSRFIQNYFNHFGREPSFEGFFRGALRAPYLRPTTQNNTRVFPDLYRIILTISGEKETWCIEM